MSRGYVIKSRPHVLIELRPSEICGIGVFAAKPIQKNRKIANGLAAEDFETLVSWKEGLKFDIAVRKKIQDFCIGTPRGFIPPENLDFNRLSIEWYLNHSCAGNVGFDRNGDFVAIRNIKKGQELTYDYGLAESNPRFVMRCMCRSRRCRRIITGNDWKRKDFRRGRTKHMLPQLRGKAGGLPSRP